MKIDYRKYLKLAINAAIYGGYEIMKIYDKDNFDIGYKEDNSPITLADKNANFKICKMLEESELNIISEESLIPDYETRKNWEIYWLIDPLDGTKEFIKRNGEFTVNIALIHQNKSVLGVIFAPFTNELYFGDIENGAYKKILDNTFLHNIDKLIETSSKLPNKSPNSTVVIVGSRSHKSLATQNYIEEIKSLHNTEIIEKGSSLKFCLIAEGIANLYPRFSSIMEWDIAAGHAIAVSAGATMKNPDDDSEIVYNKKDMKTSNFVVEFFI